MEEKKHRPLSVEELKKLRRPIDNVSVKYREGLSGVEKFAVWITEHVGTMGFFFIIFSWTLFWLGWNMIGPKNLRFDPYPAFVFWLFISNMVQIFLMPLIMVGQNLQGRHSDARAEADFEVNVRAEREIETILQHLENQNELILKIVRHLEENK